MEKGDVLPLNPSLIALLLRKAYKDRFDAEPVELINTALSGSKFPSSSIEPLT